MTSQTPRMILGSLILLVTCLGIDTRRQASLPATEQEQWIELAPRTRTQRLGLVGRIDSAQRLILTAPFDGTVRSRAPQGQVVAAGQTLLDLDSSALDLRLREALAEQLKAEREALELRDWERGQDVARVRRALRATQLQLVRSERELKDTAALYERGIVARMELDTLQQQVQIQRLDRLAGQAELQAALERGNATQRQIAEMQLRNAEENYQNLLKLKALSELKAPFDGLVVPVENQGDTALPVQRGSRVSQGQALFGLVSLEQLEVVARVEEIDVNRVEPGQPVEVRVDAFDSSTLSGTVSSVAAQTLRSDSQASASYEVRTALTALTDEQRRPIRLGMSARLTINLSSGHDQTTVVPETALIAREEQWFVNYRSTMESPVEVREVRLGRSTPDGVEVTDLDSGFIRNMPPTNRTGESP